MSQESVLRCLEVKREWLFAREIWVLMKVSRGTIDKSLNQLSRFNEVQIKRIMVRGKLRAQYKAI